MTKFDEPYPVLEDGKYLLKWNPTPQETITRQVAEKIAHDRDGKLRNALIALGWTPPPDETGAAAKMRVHADETVPDGEVHIRDDGGNLLGKIVNLTSKE